jgi:hypothetical protein
LGQPFPRAYHTSLLLAGATVKMGWTYNTRDPDAPTTGPLITGVAGALTLLSLITICLRTYVRAFLIRAFGVGRLPGCLRKDQ